MFNLESGELERKVDLAGGGILSLVADARGRLVVGPERSDRQRLAPRPHSRPPPRERTLRAASTAWP